MTLGDTIQPVTRTMGQVLVLLFLLNVLFTDLKLWDYHVILNLPLYVLFK